MHILQPRAQRAHRHPPTGTFSPIVGNVYPIQMYILKNAHSPTPRPKGAQTPSNFLPSIPYPLLGSIVLHQSEVVFLLGALGGSIIWLQPLTASTSTPTQDTWVKRWLTLSKRFLISCKSFAAKLVFCSRWAGGAW